MSEANTTNDQAEPCRSCGTALAHDQRYCLNCGVRRSEQRVPVGPVLTALAAAASAASLEGSLPPMASSTPVAVPAVGAAGLAASFANKPAASAGLALLMVGAIIGSAFGPPLSNTFAAGRRVVIVQAAGAPATGPAAAADPAVDAPVDPVVTPAPAVPVVPTPPAPTPATPTTPTTPTNPNIGHVFLVLLPGGGSGQTLAAAGGAAAHASRVAAQSASDGDYLKSTLAKKGTLLENFRQVSKSGVANRIALFSGQPPNLDTEAGCLTATKVPDTAESFVDGAVAPGAGCIFPATVKTLADRVMQTDMEGVRVYKEAPPTVVQPATPAPLGDHPSPAESDAFDQATKDFNAALDVFNRSLCPVPAVGQPIASPIGGVAPTADDPSAWFESVSGTNAYCLTADGGNFVNHPLSSLKADLAASAAAPVDKPFPALTIIVPSPCRGQAATGCPDGTSGGPAALDAFLKDQISGTVLSSSIYKADGMSVVAWDRPPALSGRRGLAAAGSTIAPSGAVVLSPFAKAGTVNKKAYDTWDLLLTIQDRLGIYNKEQLILPLGRSNDSGTQTFGTDVFKKKLDPRPAPSF
ncbi:MAG: hypothetical protein NTX07_01645 [Solirubrobacterales bacterium]|nr:hypothetical protein [Solirubrobacterales bacterium]